MRRNAALVVGLLLVGCSATSGTSIFSPETPRSPTEKSSGFLYVPLDPLPVRGEDIFSCSAQASETFVSSDSSNRASGLVSGTLLVQTLGITGEKVASALPLPSELNQTTVQNAILSLGTIKAGLYSSDSSINARAIGFYNTTGVSDQSFLNRIISELAKEPVEWNPCGTQLTTN